MSDEGKSRAVDGELLSPQVIRARGKRYWYIGMAAGALAILWGVPWLWSGDDRGRPEPAPRMVEMAPPDVTEARMDRLRRELNETRERLDELALRGERRDEEIRDGLDDLREMLREAATRPPPQKEEEPRSRVIERERRGETEPDPRDPSSYVMPKLDTPPGFVPPPPVTRSERPTRPDGAEVARPPEPEPERKAFIMRADGGDARHVGDRHRERDADYDLVRAGAYAGFLPGGSFATAALITGVDAGASEHTRANPQPVLLRLQSDASVASTRGEVSYALQGCRAMGSGYGELASTRAEFQITRLICVDPERKLVMEAPIRGYVVDSDGKKGVRGKLRRREGALMARALLASLAEGIATVSTAQATQQTWGSFGVTETIDSSEVPRAAVGEGVANAAQMLAEMYIEQARAIFPVIEVPPGRVVTVVISVGQQLRWQPLQGTWIKSTEEA